VTTNAKTMRWNAINERILSSGAFAGLTVPTAALKRRFASAEHVPNAAPESLARSSTEHQPPTPPVFGVIARLSKEKGIDVFLEAVRSFPPPVSFEVIGEGPEASRLRAHPVASRIRWLGYRSDAAERMQQWSALVIPSRSEGLPIVLLEAMAQHVPVVATSVGGIPDAITDGEHGILVEPDDGGALARGMAAILENPSGAAARAGAAHARFLAYYTLGRVGDQLERFYTRVIKERS
jgi:glycosyltransferase involved in cell wall biosynthesis